MSNDYLQIYGRAGHFAEITSFMSIGRNRAGDKAGKRYTTR